MPAIKLDNNGIMLEPKVHDGQFVALVIEGHDVRLTVRCVTHDFVELVLHEVVRMTANELWEGNIVFGFEVITDLKKVPEELLGQVFHTGKKAPYAELEVCCRGKSMFVEMSSSYGAALLAICHDITYRLIAGLPQCA